MSLQKELSVNLGLPETPMTENKELFLELIKVYNAIKNLAYALDGYTGAIAPPTSDWSYYSNNIIRLNGQTKVYVPFYETMTIGNTVSFMNDAGTAKVRKAQDGSYVCHGFASTDTNAGDWGEVTLMGRYPNLSAGTLTTGAKYFQSGTAGLIGASGTGSQCIGFAMSDTALFFNPQL